MRRFGLPNPMKRVLPSALGATEERTWGRWPSGTPGAPLYPLRSPLLGRDNAGPVAGRIVRCGSAARRPGKLVELRNFLRDWEEAFSPAHGFGTVRRAPGGGAGGALPVQLHGGVHVGESVFLGVTGHPLLQGLFESDRVKRDPGRDAGGELR